MITPITGNRVEVKRNVGSIGPCWLPGVYISKMVDGKHLVRLTGGDFQEQVTCDIDTMRITTMIPVNSIVIPVAFKHLCATWSGGQDCMLYAVSSTGGLTTGTRLPRGCDTDEQWYLTVWRELSHDVGCTVRQASRSGCDDLQELADFEDWVDGQVIRLERSYGLAGWDACDA